MDHHDWSCGKVLIFEKITVKIFSSISCAETSDNWQPHQLRAKLRTARSLHTRTLRTFTGQKQKELASARGAPSSIRGICEPFESSAIFWTVVGCQGAGVGLSREMTRSARASTAKFCSGFNARRFSAVTAWPILREFFSLNSSVIRRGGRRSRLEPSETRVYYFCFNGTELAPCGGCETNYVVAATRPQTPSVDCARNWVSTTNEPRDRCTICCSSKTDGDRERLVSSTSSADCGIKKNTAWSVLNKGTRTY